MAIIKISKKYYYKNTSNNPSCPSTPPRTPTTSPYPPLQRCDAMLFKTPQSVPFPKPPESNLKSYRSKSWSYSNLRPRRLFSDANPIEVSETPTKKSKLNIEIERVQTLM